MVVKLYSKYPDAYSPFKSSVPSNIFSNINRSDVWPVQVLVAAQMTRNLKVQVNDKLKVSYV